MKQSNFFVLKIDVLQKDISDILSFCEGRWLMRTDSCMPTVNRKQMCEMDNGNRKTSND